MTRPAPSDPAARPDGEGLAARLALAGAGIALCALVAAQGLPSGAGPTADSRDRLAKAPDGPVADAPDMPLADGLVRVAARAPADVPDAFPVPTGLAGASDLPWPAGTGFPAVSLGDFGDLAIGAPVRRHAGAPVAAGRVPESSGPAAGPDPASADAFVVMIDPGHGGTDPGSVAPNGLTEKELTADIAARARRFLSEVEGIEVRLTREGDAGLSRQGRVDRIREAGADLVVSLHFNHLPQSEVTLVESFYAAAENIEESRRIRAEAAGGALVPMVAPDLGFTEGSARLASLVQRRVFGEVVHGNPGATDAGVKRDTLFVLTRSFVAGALVELTCISNPGEAERLETEAYRDRLAAALADAVRDYRASLAERPLGSLDT